MEDKKDIKAPRERERGRRWDKDLSRIGFSTSGRLVTRSGKKNANYFFTCKHFTVIIKLIGFKEYVCVICSHRPIYP